MTLLLKGFSQRSDGKGLIHYVGGVSAFGVVAGFEGGMGTFASSGVGV